MREAEDLNGSVGSTSNGGIDGSLEGMVLLVSLGLGREALLWIGFGFWKWSGVEVEVAS